MLRNPVPPEHLPEPKSESQRICKILGLLGRIHCSQHIKKLPRPDRDSEGGIAQIQSRNTLIRLFPQLEARLNGFLKMPPMNALFKPLQDLARESLPTKEALAAPEHLSQRDLLSKKSSFILKNCVIFKKIPLQSKRSCCGSFPHVHSPAV